MKKSKCADRSKISERLAVQLRREYGILMDTCSEEKEIKKLRRPTWFNISNLLQLAAFTSALALMLFNAFATFKVMSVSYLIRIPNSGIMVFSQTIRIRLKARSSSRMLHFSVITMFHFIGELILAELIGPRSWLPVVGFFLEIFIVVHLICTTNKRKMPPPRHNT